MVGRKGNIVECSYSFVFASVILSRNPSESRTVWKHEVRLEASEVRKLIVY